jgi:hypothetical protein
MYAKACQAAHIGCTSKKRLEVVVVAHVGPFKSIGKIEICLDLIELKRESRF